MLEQQLGDDQYFPPGCKHVPTNRLFAQFHSRQSKQMKEEIINDVTSENPVQRLLQVTIAFGMRIDPPFFEKVIHFEVPRKLEEGQEEMANLPQQLCIITATILQLIWKGWMTV